MNNSSVDNYSVDVQSIYITSLDGSKVLDIKSSVIAISIVEDIFSPYISCELSILDFNNIVNTFPLVGEEYLIINFQKEDAGGLETTQTSYTFLIYKQSKGGIGENNKFQGYVLNGVSIERFLDNSLNFSQSYHASYGEMVRSIYNQYFSSSGKEVVVEPTKGIHKFIAPAVSPLTAINMIKKRSLSTKEPYSPYVFFQNQKQIVFSSINTLFSNAIQSARAKISHYYTNALLQQDTSMAPPLILGDNSVNDIISVSILNKYDSISKADSNVYSGTSKYFDLTTKAYVRRPFNFTEKKSEFFLGNPKGTETSASFADKLSGSGIGGPFSFTDIGTVVDGVSQDFYPEAKMSMIAYRELILQERIVINMYGNNNIKAGDAINLALTLPDGKIDPTLSGYHLISSVKHMITFDNQSTYMLSLECLKGSYIKKVEDLSNG